MDDLTMTRLCAEAMGLTVDEPTSFDHWTHWNCRDSEGRHVTYDPLHDDAQCFALVKRLKLTCIWADCEWIVNVGDDQPIVETSDPTDINRAIVECAAKMQAKESSLVRSPDNAQVK